MIYQVLIVDDEEIVCRGMAQFVKWKEYGFEVAAIATSVDEALLILRKMHIDVVFTDIRMPEKSGIDLLREIREQKFDTQCVILSGYSDFDYAKEAMRYGAVEYLTKPVNLREVEQFLDRMRTKLNKLVEERLDHTRQMEGLLLSIARGYASADIEKYGLPELENWYGVSIFMTERTADTDEVQVQKKLMKDRILAVIPETIVLDSGNRSLFAVIPFQTKEQLNYFVSVSEQVCSEEKHWALAVSKEKKGIYGLSEAWKETESAMRYLLADTKKNIIFYKNIETLYAEEAVEVPKLITAFLQKLHTPEERRDAAKWMEKMLKELEKEKQMDVLKLQTICIRIVIEVNGYLKEIGMEESSLHDRLNEALKQLLLCAEGQEVLRYMESYLEWIMECIGQADHQNVGGGVISEMQSFIRQHYNENISLNMLAEQFYMHPNYLSRLFKEKTGENFVEYLTEVRMQKAQELLRDSEYKIIEICGMVGYDNPRSFSKAFKHFTGMTPRECRER